MAVNLCYVKVVVSYQHFFMDLNFASGDAGK